MENEDVLGTTEMRKHVNKTIIGSSIGSLFVAMATGISFYYSTNSAIVRLNEKQDEMNKIIQVHTEQINKATNGMGMNEVQQANFDKRLTSIEENQKQIYTILLQINSNLKK
jgi:predicted PurR-regulated permease PerM